MAPPRGRLGTSTLRREGRSGVATETGCSMILGRQDEFDTLRSFVARIPEGRSGLLLEGSPGIGKTTLWLEAVSIARQEGFRVLTTRASESEARWSYAGLGDLLAEVDDGALGGLPPPQRHALETALLRAETQGPPPDQRAVSLAVLGVVRGLAAADPLVLAVDDVQWLDTSSARVLSFVIRRLSSEPIAAIATLRIGSDAPPDQIALDRAIPSLVRLRVGPLAEDPLGRILRERTNMDLPRPVVVRM